MDLLFDNDDELEYFTRPKGSIYKRPVARRGTVWGDLVAFELSCLWQLRRTLDRAGAGVVLRQFISNNPYRDISLLTWFIALGGLYEYGLKFFWVVIVNLFIAAALRAIVQAPRPFEYDRRLRPLADRQMTSYGFPSIESFMAVIIYGYLAYRMRNPLLQLVTVALSLFIGFTRLYAGSRFIHQVLLSWVLGATALYYYIHRLVDWIPDWNVRESRRQIALVAPFAACFLAYVCLAIEDNSSNILRVPNSEFIRVMTHIMDTGSAAATANDSAAMGPLASASVEERQRLLRDGEGPSFSAVERKRRQLARRHDSFFYLQSTMRRRAGEGPEKRGEQDADVTVS